MDLTNLIRKVLFENINPLLVQLKDKYVGDGKLFSEEEFKKLEEVTNNKWYLVAWLTKKVASNIIKKEDIYKWKEYFQIFDKNKKKFKFQDINLFKTPDDIQNFIETVIEIREGDAEIGDIPTSNAFLSKNEISKLVSDGRNKYLGFYKPSEGLKKAGEDGYQVFQISDISEENWKIYRDLLGRCKGRERGAKIEICTIGDYKYFKQYLKDPKGSHYIVLFNLNDPLSPYQLHVETDQFMNKNDVERYNFDKENFIYWLSEKTDFYNLKKIAQHMGMEIPFEDKGFRNEKGKQGLWAEYSRKKIDSIFTYVNDKQNGPAIYFWSNGKVRIKGTFKNGNWVGEFENYDWDGTIAEKGVFGRNATPKGVWIYHSNFGNNVDILMKNHDDPSALVSGLTKNNLLKILSDSERHLEFTGKIMVLNPSGSPKALGKLTPTGKKSGLWTIFNPDGSIRLEGNFKNNEPTGEWTFFFKWKSEPHLYVYNFDTREKGKVYTKEGEFVKKVPYHDDKVPNVRKFFEF